MTYFLYSFFLLVLWNCKIGIIRVSLSLEPNGFWKNMVVFYVELKKKTPSNRQTVNGCLLFQGIE